MSEPSPQHRVFIGLSIRGDMAKACLNYQKHIKQPARLVSSHNLHCTLLPPWQTHQIDVMATKLKAVADHTAPFDIHSRHFTRTITRSHGALLWLELQSSQALVKLYEDLMTEFKVDEHRTFLPHITLAYLTSDHHVDGIDTQPLSLTVSSLQLYESVPGGGAYKTLISAPLMR